MDVKIKKLVEEAQIPAYAKPGDAGMDLKAVSKTIDKDGNCVYGTGLAFEIPEGFMGLIFPRSSNAKKSMLLSNSIGVIDSGYRGEVMLKYKPSLQYNSPQNPTPSCWEVGERVGQIIILPYPTINFVEVDELSDTERGAGGFGHTGK